jgi:hypothetical protein
MASHFLAALTAAQTPLLEWFNASWATDPAVRADIRERLHAGLPVHIENALAAEHAEELYASLARAGHWPVHRTQKLPDPEMLAHEVPRFPEGELEPGVCDRFGRQLADSAGAPHLPPLHWENFYYHHHNQIILDEHPPAVAEFNRFLGTRDALSVFESLAATPAAGDDRLAGGDAPSFGCPGTMGLTPSWYSPLDFSAPHTDEDGGSGDRQIALVLLRIRKVVEALPMCGNP